METGNRTDSLVIPDFDYLLHQDPVTLRRAWDALMNGVPHVVIDPVEHHAPDKAAPSPLR